MSGLDKRHCASCGHLCDREAEFHPWMFCVLKKAGIHDPWEEFRRAAAHLNIGLPTKPPLVRTLSAFTPTHLGVPSVDADDEYIEVTFGPSEATC